MYIIDLYKLGESCRFFRKKHGYRLVDVADDIGYSQENVSAFEHGRNDNLRIFLWYVFNGYPIEELRKSYGEKV